MVSIREIIPLTEFKKQVIKFGLIGVLAVLTDLTAYYVLLKILPDLILGINDIYVAKTLSFLCGLVVTYNLNKQWTWRKRDKSRKRLVKFMILYMISLLLNVLSNAAFLFILLNYKDVLDVSREYFIAFICATVLCSLFNFLGQKFWVFKGSDEPIEDNILDETIVEQSSTRNK